MWTVSGVGPEWAVPPALVLATTELGVTTLWCNKVDEMFFKYNF